MMTRGGEGGKKCPKFDDVICERPLRVRVWGWVRVMVEFGIFSAIRGWVRVLGYGLGLRGRRVKSRDCALASDLIRA